MNPKKINLDDVVRLLIKERETAFPVLDEYRRRPRKPYDTSDFAFCRRGFVGSPLCMMLSYERNKFSNLVETVAKATSSAELIQKLLDRYEELRNGRFSTVVTIGSVVIPDPEYIGSIPADVVRVMCRYGWKFYPDAPDNIVRMLCRLIREDQFEHLRAIAEFDVLGASDRLRLLSVSIFTVSFNATALWLLRHDEATAHALWGSDNCDTHWWGVPAVSYDVYQHPEFVQAIDDLGKKYRNRVNGLRCASVLLCAERGEWTFAFYKTLKFLY